MSLREQLLAIRSMAEATAAMAGDMLAGLDEAKITVKSGQCDHPEDKRVNVGTMASPHAWVCGVCQHQGGE